MAEPDYTFDLDKEEELMNETKEPDTPKTGEAESFIKERDQPEEDQLAKVLHATSMPTLEDQVAQADTKLISEMGISPREGTVQT
eukprot:7700889-Prorocentrum_lima.AAC.1